MRVTLQFCRLAYETIIGQELPGDMEFIKAAKLARAKDPARFNELLKKHHRGEI